jgi:alkylhydroperoxidase family enzyme
VQSSVFPVEIEQAGHPPAPYADVIESMRRAGTSVEQILQMFGDQERTGQLGCFMPDAIGLPSQMNTGFLQLIAAFVSKANQCQVCMKAHATVAAELLTADLVTAVLDNLEDAQLSEAEKALLRFVEKTNRDSAGIGRQDIVQLNLHGWHDRAIYEVVAVCALFNFYHHWVDASGLDDLSQTSSLLQNCQITEPHYQQNLEA